MKKFCEFLRGLRYKLRMMEIWVKNTVFTYRYNQSVLCNTVVPYSMLKKKSSAVAYHFLRKGVARKEWITRYIKTSEKNRT